MLLTLATLKTRLKIANTNDDTDLSAIIASVGTRFDGFCDRFLERAVSQSEDYDLLSNINLKRYPVESLALYYDFSRVFAPSSLLLADSDYFLNARTGQVRLFLGISNVQITPFPMPMALRAVVTGGYVSAGTTPGAGQTAIPDDITGAMLQQCEFEWRNHADFGRTAMSMAGQSVSVADFNLMPGVKDILATYKRFSF